MSSSIHARRRHLSGGEMYPGAPDGRGPHRRGRWDAPPGACCWMSSALGCRYHITTPEGLMITVKLSCVFRSLMISPLYTSCTWKRQQVAVRMAQTYTLRFCHGQVIESLRLE